MSPNKALFLDRDGVINADFGYVHRPEDCVFIDGIHDLVSTAKSQGYFIAVVTNQAGIGRGYYSETTFHTFMDWINTQFQYQLDAIYFCPYHAKHGIGDYKKVSLDRKPEPGMLLQAINDHDLDPSQSLMIGDSEKDMVAAARANIATRLLLSDQDIETPCIRIRTLKEALSYLSCN